MHKHLQAAPFTHHTQTPPSCITSDSLTHLNTTSGVIPQTERVKNLLQYGRVGLSDPFLALQRDSIGGSVVRGGGVNEAELRALEETQLAQLEHLIAQQRKAHQRMRHVLREAEKVREPV